jgi:solute carrier family 35 (UDP-galactose transporter), member B1
MTSQSDTGGVARLTICALGICVCYMYYGMIQESLLRRQKIGASFVLLTNCITNSVVARVWQSVDRWWFSSSALDEKKNDIALSSLPLHQPLLALTSLCYVTAMVCSNESLHYVTYPTAVLAKSCKLIPTMAMGVLVEHKIYEITQWLAALCITSGIVLFNFSGMNHTSHEEQESSLSGLALLSMSLLMDGFLGSCQGLLKQKKTLTLTIPALLSAKLGREIEIFLRPPNAVETMLFVNLYAILYLIPLTIFNQQMPQGLAMLRGTVRSSIDANEEGAHRTLLLGLLVLNLTVAAGQIFIFLTIHWFSSLVCTTITTTRKFFTILFSIFYFGHHFTTLQWIATLLVFCGLYLGIVEQRTKQSKQQQLASGGKADATMNDFSTTHFSPRRTEGTKEE